MGMLGNPADSNFRRIANDSFNGDGSTTVFTLSADVNTATDIEVMVDNVQQSPYDGSYTVTGPRTLTFSAAPSTGTNNIYVIYHIGRTVAVNEAIPQDGSVTTAKIVDDAIHTSKIAAGAVTQDRIHSSVSFDPADGSITATKLAATLDLTSKTIDLPAASAGFKKIFDQTLDSNHAYMTVDNVFTSDYEVYKIYFYERRPQASSFSHEGRFVFRTGGASGADYTGTYTARKYRDYSGHTTYECDLTNTSSLQISPYNALDRGQVVEMFVYNIPRTDVPAYYNWWHMGFHPGNSYTFSNNGRGGLIDASIIPTGFKFYSPTASQGNYTIARCVVYGAKL